MESIIESTDLFPCGFFVRVCDMERWSKEACIHSLFDDEGFFESDDEDFHREFVGDSAMAGDGGGCITEAARLGVGQNIEERGNSASGDVGIPEKSMGEEGCGESGSDRSSESSGGWFPAEGMVVENVVDAFIKYSEYARCCGFEVRFRSTELSPRSRKFMEDSGVVIPPRRRTVRGIDRNWLHDGYEFCSRVRLQCVKGEKWRGKGCDRNRVVRSQATGCKAGVYLVRKSNGLWEFRKVTLEHNHECDSNSTRFMKNYRIVSGVDEMQIIAGDRAGVTPARGYMNFVVRHGGFENVPFSLKDSHSVLRRWRLKCMENGDFNAMQKVFNEMKASSEGFFYSYDTDVEGRLKNVVWADARSRAAFEDFGDVLCFDTTYLRNRYKMPLAPFIGVNHHGQSILLGCALMSKENTESFKWIFETWLGCMGKKAPKYIMTDQCQAIGNAISVVFPNARHRWCLWHVLRNGERHLRRKKQWSDIRKEMSDIVHGSCDSEEFEGMWSELLTKYTLEENKWLRRMFDLRQKWVPAYFCNEFWAGLQSTQRSEGMNNFFRSYVNINTGLKQFAEQYCIAVGKRVDDEEREDWVSKNKMIKCATKFECEVIFQKYYTARKFLEFQEEAKGVVYVNTERRCFDGVVRYHVVTDKRARKGLGRVGSKEFMVSFEIESKKSSCSCKMFEFKGIVCRHIVAVWKDEDCTEVSPLLIVDRWRKDRFRRASLVKIPNHKHAFWRTDDECRLGKLEAAMKELIDLAMGNDQTCEVVLSDLKMISDKCKTMLEDSEEAIRTDSQGRQYKRRVVQSCIDAPVVLCTSNVLDPVDCRGRGRVPTHRKGYKSGHRQRSKKSTSKSTRHSDPNHIQGTQAAAVGECIDQRRGQHVLGNIQCKKSLAFHSFL